MHQANQFLKTETSTEYTGIEKTQQQRDWRNNSLGF